jgi:hypothetical protein
MYHKRAERYKISFCVGWCLGLAFLLGLCRRERNRAFNDLTLLVKTIDLLLKEIFKALFREAFQFNGPFAW